MELFLFTTDVDFAKRAEEAGIDSVVVDWESKGKDARQNGFALETNCDTPEDVERLSSNLKIPVTVRVNCVGEWTQEEVDCAVEKGARILMLPMAKTVEEVRAFLGFVNKRCKIIVQVETLDLVSQTEELKKLPWDYVYVGLNDLMISKGGESIWEAFFDGTLEYICSTLRGRAYGFGGVTVLGGGAPIPFELILHEITRFGCSLSFMRRTFKKEALDRDMHAELRAIRAFIESSSLWGPVAKAYDSQKCFRAMLESIKADSRRKAEASCQVEAKQLLSAVVL